MKAKQNPSILIIGTGSLLNYGCEGIVRGTHTMIQEFWPEAHLTVASDDIYYDKELFKDSENINFITYKRRFSPYRILMGLLRRFGIGKGSPVRMNIDIVNKFDIILSAGGDNYMMAPNGSIYHLLQDLIEIGNKAYLKNKMFVLWGASVGVFNKEYRKLVKNNLNKASLLFPRESLSYTNLLDLDLIESKINLIADSAFYMDYDKSVHLPRKHEREIIIGINISLLAIKHRFESDAEGETNVFGLLDNLLKQNNTFKFLCIPHVMSDENGPQDDFSFMMKYLNQSPFKERISILDKNIGGMKTKGFISKCDILIAARMHCCVAGISSGTPTLFLTYSHKGKGMAHYAYGNDDFTIDLKEISKDILENKVKSMIDNKSSIRNSLLNNHKMFKEDSSMAIKKLKETYLKNSAN